MQERTLVETIGASEPSCFLEHFFFESPFNLPIPGQQIGVPSYR